MAPIIMLGSVGNKSMGQKIAKEIISGNLAACIYLNTVDSFSIKGNGKETIAIIKTNDKKTNSILDVIKKYKVPEFLTIPVSGGWDKYLEFLDLP